MLQESFDDIVKENMDTFDMTVSLQARFHEQRQRHMQATNIHQAQPEKCYLVQREEAVESAVKELEMQVGLYVRSLLLSTSRTDL